jgi:surface-anchored protein
MKSITTLLTAAALAALVHQPAPAGAADIVFTGGGADLTFYYNSTNNTWATVFRAKGTTGQPTTATATGLTAPFNLNSTPATWTGIVLNIVPAANGDTGDYTFTSLNPVFNTTSTVTIGQTPTTYFVSAASQSPFTTGADLGIRTRLRENQIEMGDPNGNANFNQFASFNLTLNPTASTFNGNALVGNANVSLLAWDGLTEQWTAMIDTANNETTAEFNAWDHVHRNWGFSEYGDYSLVFDLIGVGGEYGGTASVGTTTLNFEVVPEPSTYALLATALGLGALLRRRLRK